MKKLLLLASASLLLTTTYASAEWLNPPRKACIKNGGVLWDGICAANWHDAKRICSAAGGRLPSIDELRRVVTSCAGKMNSYHNKNNSAYQSCCQGRGFSSDYWSSTSRASDSSYAWGVSFRYGSDASITKGTVSFVRCVRAGQ